MVLKICTKVIIFGNKAIFKEAFKPGYHIGKGFLNFLNVFYCRKTSATENRKLHNAFYPFFCIASAF